MLCNTIDLQVLVVLDDKSCVKRLGLSSVQCEQLVEQYEPLLIQLLLQALDPEFVCMVSLP